MKNRKSELFCRRKLFIAFLIVLQALFLVYAIISTSRSSELIGWALSLLSVLVALYIINKRDKDAYKLTWVFLILLFPIFGGLFYLFFTAQTSTKKFEKKLAVIESQSRDRFLLPGNHFETACRDAPEHIPQIRYLQDFAGFPIYSRTATKYLTPGEMKFEYLLEELKKAEKYIFLEYFIIREGIMWNAILDILKEKAANGVEVRVMYDDVGVFFDLPHKYPQKLQSLGIQCIAFNPFKPFLTTKQNNRDHRKIASIDGKVAFTGGINIADEYINAIDKHGHWKDASIMITGEAAWSLTLMFLQMWDLSTPDTEDYSKYYPWKEEECTVSADGLVQPYADSPMDTENVGEHVYLQIINTAKKYVYINTPYLIIDNSMLSALRLAAKSGVDVRIVTPHRWDKRIVHITTRSYYRDLIEAGVKIYEYTDGFIHSKTFVSDDTVATVGTTNLDFRSLYLHFECGVWMYKTSSVMEVKDDFLLTLEKCHQITEQDCKSSFFPRLLQDVLRIFAPLM
ncbi:cardiolipin synthase [Brucepastera parasyntrophica]|uniref:cardiolipin synthase n=1 Tax=Brucepastera parasyntrophica TaxID=2880008 RepID=UPI002108DF63|nr:cardiolipin synthase [Brucepastera parasyntrophica]ULQ59495.1 cardiolipin synthase [Brucepastera parasyntrophica]